MTIRKSLIYASSMLLLLNMTNTNSLSVQATASEDQDSIHIEEELKEGFAYEAELIDELANFGNPLMHLHEETESKAVNVFSTSSTKANNQTVDVERVDGRNRLRVAENISRRGWSSSHTVVIANGFKFTDALSGTPLAAHYNAPLLLVNENGISTETLAEIARLQAKNIIILGGPKSVPESVVTTLQSRGLNVQRIAGQNRYDTSRKIAEELISLRGPSTAHLVNGDAFADAVSISSVAGRYKQPILLTRANELHPEVIELTSTIKDWRIIGGPDSISTNTENQLKNRVNNSTRLSGRNRYEVNKRVLNHWGFNTQHVYIGSGEAFADVLSGSVLAAAEGTGVVLTNNNTANLNLAADYVKGKGIESFVLLGGEVTLNKNVYNTFEQLYRSIERVHQNGIYTVQAGDNFNRIAEGFGMTPFQLQQWNGQVSNINNIKIGDKLAVTRQGVESMLSASEKAKLIGTNNPSQFKDAQQFIDWIAPRAQEVASQKGEEALYPSLMIAQAIHESGIAREIGESQLARAPHYNLFGIKARNNQPYTLSWTWEHIRGENIDVLARFRSFSSYDESLEGYANLLRYGRGTGEDFYYRGTWRKNTKDVFEVLDNGGLRGYATDPKYFEAVRNYINKYNLTQYD
ncbi:cell wall-binding repeat-containing protein [Alkalibacterium iburiense]